ncbi:MAG: ribosome-associated translation inhibitor RaiA [Elusimicrobiota bacterium]
MKIQITGRHIRVTPALKAYISKKLSKAEKYFEKITWAQVMLSVEKRVHKAEVVLHAGKQTLRALAKAVDLYAAVDLASDKIDAQLRKYKERLKGRHRKAPPAPKMAAEHMDPTPVHFSVVKRVNLEPMSAADAAQEMDRLGYNFWMYHDKESRQVSVIFRRLDESFGLIQPTKRVGR